MKMRRLFTTWKRINPGMHTIALVKAVSSAQPSATRFLSTRPTLSNMRSKRTIADLLRMKHDQVPITMLTAYDYPTARQCEANGIDIVLVGDSLAQVCLGYDSTTRLTMPEILHHVKAVSRGSKSALLVADMPFGSYHTGLEDAIANAVKLIQEGGVEVVKLEGGDEIKSTVSGLTRMGIPVMAHIGLLPQRHTSMSGYKVQGRSAASAHRILEQAIVLQDAGASSIVLEAIPAALGEYITSRLSIPTIGIGAGPQTDGQVLVWDDAMGSWDGHKAKFVRHFADQKASVSQGVERYVQAVRSRTFPDDETESYSMDETEWDKFLDMEANLREEN